MTFFELGGDSIQAMRLTSLLRGEGLGLSVSDMFAWPVLEEQARGAQEHSIGEVEKEPYNSGSLLNIGTEDLEHFAVRELGCSFVGSASRHLTELEVEDILPTTEFQRQFLQHQQIHYMQLRLPMEIDPARLEKACHVVVDRHPMLRSVFLPYDGGYIQVQFRRLRVGLIQLWCDGDIDVYVERLCGEDATTGVGLGTPYFQAFLVSKSSSDSVLILRCSHAQFDGESMPLIFQDLLLAYEGRQLDEVTSPSFALYLRHRQTQANPHTYEFWKQYLQNATMTALRLSGTDSDLLLHITRIIPLPTPPRGITISSLMKAAWAVVLAQVTGQRDLVFGHALNGRDTPITGVHAISGPCVTVSPIRIIIPQTSKNSALEFLHHVQDQYTRALPYAGVDFETIRQHSTSWPANTSFCSFQTHQNGGASHPSFRLQGHDCAWGTRVIGGAPQFHVITIPLQDRGQLKVHFKISSRLGNLGDIEDLLERFCSAIADLERGILPL